MITLSPTIKGLITAALMIIVSVLIYNGRGSFENNLQYITYGLYVGGIAWTLVAYSRKEVLKTFKTYFSEGFKCFIVITFLMVLFTVFFLQANPGLREEMAQNYRTELIKTGDKTPAEIESMVIQAKEYYVTMVASTTIFSYLLIGAIFTTILSIVLLQINKKQPYDQTITGNPDMQ